MASIKYSVYIPRIFNNINNNKIIDAFQKLGLGVVEKLDIIRKTGKDNSTYYMAFIHFSEWGSSYAAINFRDRIENPEMEARLVYDDPWYWIVLPNKSIKTDESESTHQISFKNAMSKYINLNECFNRINIIEEGITRVYEEVFGREFIPSSKCKYRNEKTYDDDDIESCTPQSNGSHSHVDHTYSESSLHMPSQDKFYDLEKGRDDNSCVIIIPTEKATRQWITENMCGNA